MPGDGLSFISFKFMTIPVIKMYVIDSEEGVKQMYDVISRKHAVHAFYWLVFYFYWTMTAILDGFPDQGRAVGEFQLLLIFVCLLCCCREWSHSVWAVMHALRHTDHDHASLEKSHDQTIWLHISYLDDTGWRRSYVDSRVWKICCWSLILWRPWREQENCLSSLVLILSFLFSGFNSRLFSLSWVALETSL